MSTAIKSGFFSRQTAVCLCWGLVFAFPAAVLGQASYYITNGTEYAIVGSLPGDQVWPDVAVTPTGGFVVWQDNVTDGSGWGVSARRLDSTLSGTLSTFRVNADGTNGQENPRVALLKGGGAVFTWQGGVEGLNQHIYARFLTPTNTWTTTNDVLVNTFTNNFQINPAVAVLNNGNVIVVWSSFDEAGASSLQDVYGQMVSPTGQKIGGEFLINQFISYNQRSPAVAALANGGFVVAWVSEQERVVGTPNPNAVTPDQQAYPSIDIYARLYDANGNSQGNEFLVNADSNPCAHPSVAAGTDGGFMIAWDGHDMSSPTVNSLDIYARSFTSAGSAGAVVRVNTYLRGDQYAPRISSLGTDYLIVWTSMAQDGSREGAYGQFLRGDGTEFGAEFRVNTTTISSQMQPAVASDGTSQFLVVWTSYIGGPNSFDLFAQRYLNVAAALQPMAAPFIYAPFTLSNSVYQPQLQVSWPSLLGISVSNYEVYVNDAITPAAVTTNNIWIMTAANGLTANSTNSFRLDYVTMDGRRSPHSPSAAGATWGGQSWGGIPFEWMTEYFGSLTVTFNGSTVVYNWPSPSTPPAAGGLTLLQIFLSGGNPLDSSTWLQTALTRTQQGMFLVWNTQPGFTYQVQVTTNFTTWTNLGDPRFAAGNSDSIYVGGGSAGYYRVQLLYH
jgi:hypothetical protein